MEATVEITYISHLIIYTRNHVLSNIVLSKQLTELIPYPIRCNKYLVCRKCQNS